MFECIIKRLMKIRAPVTHKLKIPLAGTKAFDAILQARDISESTDAVKLAVKEFAKYVDGDPDVISDFEKTLIHEFSGLSGVRYIRKKAKALKEIWELEARVLAAKNKRNKWLSIRVTEEEYEAISKQAQEEGLDISNYIRKRLGLEYRS